jgi:hypothetical protein
MVHLVDPVSEGCGQSVQKRDCCDHVVAGPGEVGARWPITVYVGSDIPSLSSGIGDVDHYGPLCFECGQLDLNGYSLADEFTSLICCSVPNVCLSSMSSRLLPLLIGFQPVRRVPYVRLWYGGPQQDHQDG